MVVLTQILAFLLVSLVAASPANQNYPVYPVYPQITGSCTKVAPAISTLRTYSSRSKFCSSYLPITTFTSTTTTTTCTTTTSISATTCTTGTTTVAAETTVTVLAARSTIYEPTATETEFAPTTTETAPTPTSTAPTSSTTTTTTTTVTICGNARRDVATPKPVPAPLKDIRPTALSSACRCLSLLTPTTTTTETTTSTSTKIRKTTVKVKATETTTSTITSTPVYHYTPTTTTTITPTFTETPPATTTTPTTTITETQTSAVRIGQPAVQLTNPTPINQVTPEGKAARDYDDEGGLRINDIPFDVDIYGITSRTLVIGMNGWLSPGVTDSTTYVNSALPSAGAGVPSWVPYWSDLFITGGTTQGIYYDISGDEGHRILSIEYFMSFYRAPTAYTHFLVNLFEDEVGRVVFTYFQTTSQLATTNTIYGTIGVQDPATNEANQYSINVQPDEGLSIEWRPSTNVWSQLSAGSC